MTRRYRDREHVDYFEDTWAGQGLSELPAAPPAARVKAGVKAGLQPVRIPKVMRQRARREIQDQILDAMVAEAQAAGWYDR